MVKIQTNLYTKKLILVFKHIRFKSSTSSLNVTADFQQNTKARIEKLAEILDCSDLTAKKITQKNRSIFTLDSDSFVRNATFCSKMFKFSEIVEFPILISLNSSLLQHRYFSLVELGCEDVTAGSILRFTQITKKSPNAAEKDGLRFHKSDPIHHYLMLLGDTENKSEVRSRLLKMYRDGNSLWKIKEAMNAEFLSAKLDCSLHQVHQMFRCHSPLRIQSVAKTGLLLDVLMKEYGFSVLKIHKVPNLLSLHHEAVEQILLKVPNILGVDTQLIAHKMPLILRRDTESLKIVERVLQEFAISDHQLLSCPKVMIFDPSTLRQRLQALCNSQDFKVLKSCKKFLWLVYYFNTLSSRLEALRACDLPSSIGKFIASRTTFEKYLCFAASRTHVDDFSCYLASVFGCTEKDVLAKLQECPSFRNSSLMNCNLVVDFLLGSGVTKKQLFNGLGIIFYDIGVVKLYFKNLDGHAGCQPFHEWLSHYNLVQLLIYTIEVDAGFRGARLYKSSSKSDEAELCAISSQAFGH